MRFYSRTAFVNHFYPKNLKRATQFQTFTFFSALRFHCSCAQFQFLLLSAFCKFRSFVHSFIHFRSLLRWHWHFRFLTLLAHLHFRLLFHWSSLVFSCSATSTASAAAFVLCLCHSDDQQALFTERLVLSLNFLNFYLIF